MCGILAPWSGIKTMPSAVETQSPNHGNAREFLQMRTFCQKLKKSLEFLIEFPMILRYFGENEHLRNAEFPGLQTVSLSHGLVRPSLVSLSKTFQSSFWKIFCIFKLFWFLTTWFISWLFVIFNAIFKKFIFQKFSGSPEVRTLAWPGFSP